MDKKDKRRTAMAKRLRTLNETFSSERDVHYGGILHSLQCSLYALHMGNHPEFLERLADLEEDRDNRLVELYLWERYQTEQAEQQYSQDLEQATAEYSQMLQLVKDKLRARLENQRKRLNEDRSLLDIANDHSFFLSCLNTAAPTRSAQLSSAERRSLRRRDLGDEFSGLSGNESRSRRARATTASTNNASDFETATDRDLEGLLHDFDTPSARHVSKSYQGVKVLKPEEAQGDLSLIRENVKRFRSH